MPYHKNSKSSSKGLKKMAPSKSAKSMTPKKSGPMSALAKKAAAKKKK